MQPDGRSKLAAAAEDAVTEQVLDAANPVGDCAIANVEDRRRGGRVQTRLQVTPERVAHDLDPRVRRGQRPELALDEVTGGSEVAQQRGFQRHVVVTGHRLG